MAEIQHLAELVQANLLANFLGPIDARPMSSECSWTLALGGRATRAEAEAEAEAKAEAEAEVEAQVDTQAEMEPKVEVLDSKPRVQNNNIERPNV